MHNKKICIDCNKLFRCTNYCGDTRERSDCRCIICWLTKYGYKKASIEHDYESALFVARKCWKDIDEVSTILLSHVL